MGQQNNSVSLVDNTLDNIIKSNNLFVITAPSGAGKTSLIKALCEENPNIKVSVSYTTRPPRNDEVNGIDYFFIDSKKFEEMINNDEFVEYAKVYNNYYGTSKKVLEELLLQNNDVILEVDLQGAQSIKKVLPNAIFIFILPPNLNELAMRLQNRLSETQESLISRLGAAKNEIEHAKSFDYIVVNESFEVALQDLYSIIRVCRLKNNKLINNINLE